MLLIAHGDDTASSRTYFLTEKQKYPHALLLDGEKMTLTDLTQVFEGGGLFVQTQEVFIEQFLTKRKKYADFKDLAVYIEKQASTHTIVLWEAKEIERSALMTFKTATPRVFKLPQTLFLLMESIKPGNGKTLVSLFHKTLETTASELILFMFVRQFRLMLALSQKSEETIDEVKRLSWQRAKLEKQAALFSSKRLTELYQQLFVIEYSQKTGTLNTSLTSAIDFFLLEI